jgi:hypothetical protein
MINRSLASRTLSGIKLWGSKCPGESGHVIEMIDRARPVNSHNERRQSLPREASLAAAGMPHGQLCAWCTSSGVPPCPFCLHHVSPGMLRHTETLTGLKSIKKRHMSFLPIILGKDSPRNQTDIRCFTSFGGWYLLKYVYVYVRFKYVVI